MYMYYHLYTTGQAPEGDVPVTDDSVTVSHTEARGSHIAGQDYRTVLHTSQRGQWQCV